MAGVDLYRVSKLLGHHSLKMTERSAHLVPEYLKNIVEVLVKMALQAAPEQNDALQLN